MVKSSTWFSLLGSLVCSLILCELYGQSLIADYYSVDDGLANRLVTDLLLDKRGFVWIASENGLDRYDGYEFYHFSRSGKGPGRGRLSQDHITDLAMDADGKLMIFYDGLYTSFDRLDPLTLVVERVEVSLHLKKGEEARAFYVSPEGHLYVMAKDKRNTSIYRYNKPEEDFQACVQLAEEWLANYPQVDMLALSEERFLVHDEAHGLRLLTPSGKKDLNLEVHAIDSLRKAEPGPARFLYRSKEGKIYLSLTEVPGLLQFTADSMSLSRYSGVPDSLEYGRIYEDERGNLLLNVSKFTARYPSNEDWYCLQADGQVSHFRHLGQVGDYVTAVGSRNFFQDIIFGLDTGFKEVRNTATKVQRLLYQDLPPGERGYSMRGITSDGKGTIYFAREVERWYKYDKESGVFDTITLNDPLGNLLHFTNGQGLVYDKEGYLWGFSSNGTVRGAGYVHQYDLENCQNTIFRHPDYIRAYSDLVDEKIWLGTEREGQASHLLSFNTKSKVFQAFVDIEGKNPFEFITIRYILASRYWPNILWVGSEQGLFKVNTATGAYTYFYGQQTATQLSGVRVNLQDNTIFALYEDEYRNLWIGTENGLHRYNPAEEQWDVYTVSDGLTSNTVACILPDPNSDGLWVSTYNGLSYFVPDAPDEQRRFTSIDGFAHSEFNRFSAFLDEETGRIYMGGVNGLSAFYPEDLLVQPEVPEPLLASFSYYDGRKDTLITQVANLYNGVSLRVEPYYDYFNFNFSLPIYTPNTENQFRYRIGNAPTQEWIYLKDSRSLSYSNIKKGNYTFYVQAADPNGNWSDETLIIYLRVKEAFWNSPLFIILMIGGILAASFWFYRDRVEQKLQMERLRTQLASDLHDEVSGLLAGISLQTEIIRGQTDDATLNGKLKRIWEASQGAMSKMSDVIWSIDARRDRMADLITRMEEHADEVLLPLGIRYQIKTYHLDIQQNIPATIRQNLYFIYKESINNVAKHAKTSRVDIVLGHEDKHFEMLIKDNGTTAHIPVETIPGRRKRKGQGLSNLRMRAQRLQAELEILRGQGFTIHLRMKRFL